MRGELPRNWYIVRLPHGIGIIQKKTPKMGEEAENEDT